MWLAHNEFDIPKLVSNEFERVVGWTLFPMLTCTFVVLCFLLKLRMASNSAWCIARCFLQIRNELLFEIRKDTKIQTLKYNEVVKFVTSKEIENWILRDTRGAMSSIGDYTNLLLNQRFKLRSQLFWGDEKLFSYNCEYLRTLFSEFPKATRIDLKDVLHQNDEVVTHDLDETVYQPDVIACVVSAAIDKDLQGIIDKQINFDQFDAAARVVEGSGISSSIWNCEQGEIYIRARMKEYTFAQQVKMIAIPGTIKSCVLRQSMQNIVGHLNCMKYSVMWVLGTCEMDEISGCVTPTSQDLASWIKYGLCSTSADQTSCKIIFNKVGTTKLIKCLQLYNFRHSQYHDRIGILIGGTKLLVLLTKKTTMSQDVVDVWQSVWKGFQPMICMNEPVEMCKILMKIKYYLSVHDANFVEWIKTWKCLLKHDNNTYDKWLYFIQDVLIADRVANNYCNVNHKNEYVLAGIRKMFRMVKTEQDLVGVENVIEWLYHVNNQNSNVVTREIIWNIDQIDNVEGRFACVLSVFKYYVFKSGKPVGALKRVFSQYLPVVV